jgi:hypothetical protein
MNNSHKSKYKSNATTFAKPIKKKIRQTLVSKELTYTQWPDYVDPLPAIDVEFKVIK